MREANDEALIIATALAISVAPASAAAPRPAPAADSTDLSEALLEFVIC